MSLGSTHRQEFFDLIKSLIVDWLFRGSMPMDCLIIAFLIRRVCWLRESLFCIYQHLEDN